MVTTVLKKDKDKEEPKVLAGELMQLGAELPPAHPSHMLPYFQPATPPDLPRRSERRCPR